MSVMCLSDGSHWPATTAEYQKKKKKSSQHTRAVVEVHHRVPLIKQKYAAANGSITDMKITRLKVKNTLKLRKMS